ncbi:hypothetical protein [Prauserella cavernicola]|uniref:Uncharacterized protein n=1 Tax=Prauserella cavernicola TaxID=2800127 RepID=A0A934V8Z1_9PSEU|nr:hypothetical protein [Prauserella cavernicola]MBK1789174.1 hypothetical protein [Prauserella cavernicola]
MALIGRAFLAIWNDLADGTHEAWSHWHSAEHIPERIATPGFRRARRWLDPTDPEHPYFCLYEIDDLTVLDGAEYLAHLDSPTRWSAQNMGSFRNYLRSMCVLRSTAGTGTGGHLATVRLYGEPDPADIEAVVGKVTGAADGAAGLVGAHTGTYDTSRLGRQTTESRLRGNAGAGQEPFAAVAMVESLRREDAVAAADALVAEFGAIAGVRSAARSVYTLHFALTDADPSSSGGKEQHA